MKIYTKIILIHIKRYEKIDYCMLEEELHMSQVSISKIIKDLYDKGIIIVEGNKLHISPKFKDELVEDDSWYSPQLKDKKMSNFEWNYLYIPKNFNIIE